MQRGVAIDAICVEPGISGGTPFAERPEAGRLWSRLVKGDIVVAAKLDRMFRSAGDCLNVVKAFNAKGISLFLLDMNGGSDDVSGNGIARLILTMVSAFAEFERDRIGERIRQAKQDQKSRGEYLGGTPRFGWRRDSDVLVRDEAQQEAIERMQMMRDEGASFRTISSRMKEEGISISHQGVVNALASDNRD